MNTGKITVITPPDHLFNSTLSYFLVKPSLHVKQQLHHILCETDDDINIFIFDDHDYDIAWLLGTANQSDIIIIDIDNCDHITKMFITFLIAHENVYYITADEVTPYHLISKNRIYNLELIAARFNDEDNFNEED